MTIRHTQEADKEMQIRLEAQKNDYEATIQRHLNFIDQVLLNFKNYLILKTKRPNRWFFLVLRK